MAGLLNRGSLRAQALCLELVLTPRASYLQLRQELNWNWLNQAVCDTWLYNCLTLTCFQWAYASRPNSTTSKGQGDIPISSTGCTCFALLLLIYTRASLDWLLGRGSICNTYGAFFKYFMFCKSFWFFSDKVRIVTHSYFFFFFFLNNPVDWSCRIQRLHLCSRCRIPLLNVCLDSDTKLSEASVMTEVSRMWSTPSLPSLPGSLCSGVVAPDRSYLWVQ